MVDFRGGRRKKLWVVVNWSSHEVVNREWDRQLVWEQEPKMKPRWESNMSDTRKAWEEMDLVSRAGIMGTSWTPTASSLQGSWGEVASWSDLDTSDGGQRRFEASS